MSFENRGEVIKRASIIAVCVAFVLGTGAFTFVQAATKPESSGWIDIWGETGGTDDMYVKLKIHRYTENPHWAIMHYLLSIQNQYDDDIHVKYLSIEAWSDDKDGPGSPMLYGKNSATDIHIAGWDTEIIRLNQKAQNFSSLMVDTSVYVYAYIEWTHGINEHSLSWSSTDNPIDAKSYWDELFSQP